MAFLPKGKAKAKPKKQFTDEGDLFAIEFDKAESFAMQNAQRITEVGKSFAKSFVNFQKNFDKNTKDFAIQQKASFREREEELVKTFSDGPLAEGELLKSFDKLKQYMDDADVSIQEFTGRMKSGGDELKKTFDSITNGLDEQEKKQRKLTQAGVATEAKIIDGKVQLVALTKDEIFKKQQLMHTLEKEIEADDKELKRLSKRNDLTQEQMDRQVELIDNIENNNEEIRDIQAQGVKKLKGDLGLFGQFGRVLSDGYNEFRSSFDEKVNAFFPAPLAGIITGFVDSIQTIGGQLLDFAKPFIQTAKVLIAAPKVIGEFFSEGGGFQKGLQAFDKGMKKVIGGFKKLALALLGPILPLIGIIAALALLGVAIYKLLKFLGLVSGDTPIEDRTKDIQKKYENVSEEDAKKLAETEIKKENEAIESTADLGGGPGVAESSRYFDKMGNEIGLLEDGTKVLLSTKQERALDEKDVFVQEEDRKDSRFFGDMATDKMAASVMEDDEGKLINPETGKPYKAKETLDYRDIKGNKELEEKYAPQLEEINKIKKENMLIRERIEKNLNIEDDAIQKKLIEEQKNAPTIIKQDNTSVSESNSVNKVVGPITENTSDYYSKKAAGLMF